MIGLINLLKYINEENLYFTDNMYNMSITDLSIEKIGPQIGIKKNLDKKDKITTIINELLHMTDYYKNCQMGDEKTEREIEYKSEWIFNNRPILINYIEKKIKIIKNG